MKKGILKYQVSPKEILEIRTENGPNIEKIVFQIFYNNNMATYKKVTIPTSKMKLFIKFLEIFVDKLENSNEKEYYMDFKINKHKKIQLKKQNYKNNQYINFRIFRDGKNTKMGIILTPCVFQDLINLFFEKMEEKNEKK